MIDFIKYCFTETEGRILLICVIALIAVCGGETYYSNCNERVIENCVVTDKAVKQSKEDSKYLVFTKVNDEVEVFEITDSIIQGRYNSSDMYAVIEVGKTYDFKVVGERIPFFSMYPNIIGYENKRGD